jgi:uncharacterized membrane protein YdfJ with MMPL/SSD domain
MGGLRTRDAVVEGLKSTGGIITSAGLIMMISFSSLLAYDSTRQAEGNQICVTVWQVYPRSRDDYVFCELH